MKNLKFTLVVAILTFATVSFGTKAPDQSGSVQVLSLEQAMTNPALVYAMYQQLDPEFVSKNHTIYYANVEFEDKIYSIYGTQKAWRSFFMRNLRARPGVISSL